MLEPGDPYWVECLLSLATQRQKLGEIDHAQEALRAAADAADPWQAVMAKVLMCRQNTLTADSRAADSEEVLREAARQFREWDDDRGLAQVYLVQADVACLRGYLARGAELLEQALKHGELAGDAGCIARARSLIGVTVLFGPTPCRGGNRCA